jgi:hypothetical protein
MMVIILTAILFALVVLGILIRYRVSDSDSSSVGYYNPFYLPKTQQPNSHVRRK